MEIADWQENKQSGIKKNDQHLANTMTKLNRDEEVALSVLSKICESLKTDIGDIVEYFSVEAAEEQKWKRIK